jgi:hypothetical protein
MQCYFVLLLVAAASATPLTNLLKHKPNNAPVLNLNHKNIHYSPLVDTMEVVSPYTTLTNQVVSGLGHQVVSPYTTLNNQVVSQVVPQVYAQVQKEVLPQVYTHQIKEVAPKVVPFTTYSHVAPQVYTPTFKAIETEDIVKTAIPTPVFKTIQTIPTPVFKTIQTPVVVPQPTYVKTVVQAPVAPVQTLTPGYVAANHGALHTAPLPEGPSNDGFFASHHINLPNAKA